MKEEIKDYLVVNNLLTEEKLANHILELRRNTFVKPILHKLVDLLYNNKDVLLSFFAEKNKPKGILVFTALEDSIFSKKEQEKLHNVNNGSFLDEVMERIENQERVQTYSQGRPIDFNSYQYTEEERKVFKDWNNSTATREGVGKYDLKVESKDENIGIKEVKGKLYYELSWEFIEEMAKRMANNKSDKYPLYNWKKNINIEELKQAINRHHIEVMKGNYKDEDEVLGHIVSYACNSMMLWEQLRLK